MSIAAKTSREITEQLSTGRSRDRGVGSLVFLGLLWFSLFFGILVLLALIISTAIKGVGAVRRRAVDQLHLGRAARDRPASVPASWAACG